MTRPDPPAPIDARGPQFNASLTSAVLVLVLLTATTVVGVALLALQAVLFASGAVLGVRRTPAAQLFSRLVRPRLGPPTRLEDPRPPRFAQGVGLVFALVGLAGFLLGPTWLGYAATSMALVAALLNATVQVCLGCRIYGVCHLPRTDYDYDDNNDLNPTTHKKEALA